MPPELAPVLPITKFANWSGIKETFSLFFPQLLYIAWVKFAAQKNGGLPEVKHSRDVSWAELRPTLYTTFTVLVMLENK